MVGMDVAFAGSPLDRADHLRGDPAAIAALMNARARLLRMEGLDPAIGEDGALSWGTLAEAADGAELVFLGLLDSRACFAPTPQQGSVAPPNPRLWQALASLSAPDMAIYGMARSLTGWHARHRFCAQCGAPTVPAKGGWQRNCISDVCRSEHFPRTDPVTIMLVEHQDSLLLGRQPRFPAKRFSALAGFVEPGETIEEAVAREVLEEAGLRVRDVSYVTSQPWPFPSSLMIACHSHTDDPTITLDANELEDARWFTRAEVAAAMAGEDALFIAPPPAAVARVLLHWWLTRP